MMKLTPYEQIITMGKEAIDSALAPLRARSVKKKAELEKAKLDERIATLESEVNVLCSSKDVDFEAIIRKMDEIGLMERKQKQFEKIIAEMFPEK